MQLPKFSNPQDTIRFVQTVKQMHEDGHKSIAPWEVFLYDFIGPDRFMAVSDISFRYACMYAHFLEIDQSTPQFQEVYASQRKSTSEELSGYISGLQEKGVEIK